MEVNAEQPRRWIVHRERRRRGSLIHEEEKTLSLQNPCEISRQTAERGGRWGKKGGSGGGSVEESEVGSRRRRKMTGEMR